MKCNSIKRILITGSGGPMGVNVTRSLLQAPEDLSLLGTDCNRFHIPLSLTHKTMQIPPASQTQDYLSALVKLVDQERIDMILPTHPSEVRTIAANKKLFANVKLQLPQIKAINCAQDKWKTWELLKSKGLPVPDTFFIQDKEDLKKCFSNISTRPIWVRGAGVPGRGIGVASLPCKKIEHAASWIDYYNGWGGFIASEYLTGQNLTWLGLFDKGELIACQSRQRHEYVIPHVSPSGITGAPAVSCTIKREDVRTTGEAAVRALTREPNGPFFVDMTENNKGLPQITEINAGRFGTTIHFYTEAGCNFPWLLVKLAFGEIIEGAPIVNPIEPDTWWLRTIDCGPVLVRGLNEK